MRRRRSLVAAVVVTGTAAAPAVAQNCANFGDVPASSPFCQHIEWIRNRGVTLGCGDGSVYCPNDTVTRLSMAAFLRRLGDALTPVDLPLVVAAGTVQTPSLGPVLCQTADYLVASFPRRAYVIATAILSAPSAAGINVSAQVVYSTNGGAWTPIPNSDQFATLYAGATPGNYATLAPFGAVDLNVTQNVRFGVQLGQFAGSGTVSAACQNRVQLVSRTGGSSPLDALPLAVDRSSAGTLPVR